MINLQDLHTKISWHYEHWILYPLKRRLDRERLKEVRKKEKIKILFVLIDLGQWKTECLYTAMLDHPKFEPILGVTLSTESPEAKQVLIKYISEKGYKYYDLDKQNHGVQWIAPDIIVFQKPYDSNYIKSVNFKKFLNTIMVYCPYGVHSIEEGWNLSLPIKQVSIQNYYENEMTAASLRRNYPKYAHNVVVTGLPFNDGLLMDKSQYKNPWKTQEQSKKKIIYAPHHTLPGMSLGGVGYSTFLDYGEFMLHLAKKYKDQIQWAFKPHPYLYTKLVQTWGKEKTDSYYNEWATLSNTQLEKGEYIGLFKHSDAMIHDCGSFTIEYHYTHNPVLYLDNGDNHTSNLNEFACRAYELHYKAKSKEDIENFIKNVLKEIDPLCSDRNNFFNTFLLPPNGKTACQNIIDAILGKGVYAD